MKKKEEIFSYETHGLPYIKDGQPVYPSQMGLVKPELFKSVLEDRKKNRLCKIQNKYR